MANLTRQQTRYMSRDEFNALDKSTVPAGTEINIVDQIQKEDLSTELLNAIESGSIPGVGIDYGSNSAEGALFIGHYNNPEENAIFQIGTGSSASDRNNLLTVYEDLEHFQPSMTFNGNAYITGDTVIGTLFVTSAPVDENGVIRKQDLDEALSQVSKPSWHSEAPEDTSRVILTKITIPYTIGDETTNPFDTSVVIVGGYQVNNITGTFRLQYLDGNYVRTGSFVGTIYNDEVTSLEDYNQFRAKGVATTITNEKNSIGKIELYDGSTMYSTTAETGSSDAISFQFLY